MRPATRAVPKELLPVGGRPAIEWVIDEALRAGMRRVVIVSSPDKSMIDAYVSQHVRGHCTVGHGIVALESSGDCVVDVVHQAAPMGLGDAVRVARSAVEDDEPLAVLLPDELLLAGPGVLEPMLEEYEHSRRSVVSLLRIAAEDAGAYGCARIAAPHDSASPVPVVGCVEKPLFTDVVSPFALSGRYVLDASVLDALDAISPDSRGEIQLTEALDQAGRNGLLVGIELSPESWRVDVGNWRGWLDANARLLAAPVGPVQVAAPLAGAGRPAAGAGGLRTTA